MNNNLLNQKNENICPYIGLSSDVQTAMENPSPQNYCHKVKPSSPPSLTHQREFCLNLIYTNCRVFSTEIRKPRLSELAEESPKSHKRIPGRLWLLMGIVLLGAMIVAGVVIYPWFFPPPPEKVITPTAGTVPAVIIPVDETPTQEMVEILVPTDQVWVAESTLIIEPQVQPTTGLTPIPAFTEAPPHLLLTPFGVERVFLLHRVTAGEDLIAIADKYQTSVEAIRAANYNMTLELWVDTVIIIPPNQADMTDITPMTPLEITGNEKSVQELAAEYGISPELLGAVNARSTEYRFQIGEWVIIPRVAPSPT